MMPSMVLEKDATGPFGGAHGAQHLVEFVPDRPFAASEITARKQDGRIHIEKINGPFLSAAEGSPAEYGAGLKLAIERGWLWTHWSGTFVKLTDTGAALFA
jgi:hypothetical protein